MNPADGFEPTRQAALERLAAVRTGDYARSRNALDGAVTGLSPYITHGLLDLPQVLSAVAARHPLGVQHKFVYELGWREYFRHVWQFRGPGIFASLREGLLPESGYAMDLPADIREAATGVAAVDEAVRALYAWGYLHNHARMWLASYVVHLRKVHWRAGADWLYGHLLDGDLASNHLSWQWVAGTASSKPYLFNADNVARFAPSQWHSPGSVIDQSYDALERIARQPQRCSETGRPQPGHPGRLVEPERLAEPPGALGWTAPDAAAVAGRDVWVVHPWSLGELPAWVGAQTVVVGVGPADFHRAWPWSERRWDFVSRRMDALTSLRWYADAGAIGAALGAARQVRSVDDPHMQPWLPRWASCAPAPALFPAVDHRCDSFSRWWARASRGFESAADLLATRQAASG